MPPKPSDNQDSYAVIDRIMRLCDILRTQPLGIADILARMPDDYPDSDSGKRKIRRDIHSLERLGYHIQRQGKPARFFVTTSAPVLANEDVRTLVALRESFPERHPLSARVQQLLAMLTSNLSARQQKLWQRRATLRMPLGPALDYSAYEGLLLWLDEAIVNRRQIGFLYKSKGKEMHEARWHPRVDPYDIEYTDRQFYLIGYSYDYHTILTFRINRIVQDEAQQSPQLLPSMQHPKRERKAISFTYRLPVSFTDGGVSERFTIHSVEQDGDFVRVYASDTSEFRIIRVLLGYGEHALLLDGPPSLMERMRSTVSKMYALYQESENAAD
jgi:predicted DNA-binding transcriptional regulator YafY